MSNMKNSQRGAANVLVVPLILLTILLLGVGIVAIVASNQASDYKNNAEEKIRVAVNSARKQTSAQKDKDFAEKEKFPYDTYNGPSAFGKVKLLYPKTWSAYVSEGRGGSGRSIDAFFAPGQVPTLNDSSSVYSLRLAVDQRSYDSVLNEYQADVKSGAVTAKPYESPNVPDVVGTRLDGEVANKKQGAMIIMPVRDTTVRVWTESEDFTADFDNVILPNFSFTP